MLRAPVNGDPGLVAYSGRDEFNQTAGALAGKAAVVGGAWAGAGDTDDFQVETTGKTAQRTATSDSSAVGSHFHHITGRVAVVGTTNYTNIAVEIEAKASALASGGAADLQAGVVARYVDVNNYLFGILAFDSDDPFAAIAQKVAGSITTLAYLDLPAGTFAADTFYRIRLLVQGDQVWLWYGRQEGLLESPVLASSTALATGGVLDDGKPGLFDGYNAAAASTRNYDNFKVWAPTPDAVLHPSRRAELRTEGMFREDVSGAAYSKVPHVVGDLPRIAPAGLEGAPSELFIKVSRGDLEQLPDRGIDDIRAQVLYRPSWLSVPAA